MEELPAAPNMTSHPALMQQAPRLILGTESSDVLFHVAEFIINCMSLRFRVISKSQYCLIRGLEEGNVKRGTGRTLSFSLNN